MRKCYIKRLGNIHIIAQRIINLKNENILLQNIQTKKSIDMKKYLCYIPIVGIASFVYISINDFFEEEFLISDFVSFISIQSVSFLSLIYFIKII